MLGNYLTSAIRALRRDKFHALLNIAGLTVALSVTLLVALYIKYEFSYEDFFSEPHQLYKVRATTQPSGQPEERMGGVPYLFATIPTENLPANLLTTYRIFSFAPDRLVGAGNQFIRANAFVVDATYFDILDYPLAHGTYSDLDRPGQAALTKSMAEQLLGKANAVGERLSVHGLEFRIAAIFEDIPSNSSLLNSISTEDAVPTVFLSGPAPDLAPDEQFLIDQWRFGAGDMYVRLEENLPVGLAETQLNSALEPLLTSDQKEANLTLKLQPINRIHLEFNEGQSLKSIYTLGVMGLLLLLIAGFNYVNLSTAQGLLRTKEVGIRKVLGARRWQLTVQFLGTTLVMTAVSFVLAFGLAALLLPAFSVLVERPLNLAHLISPTFLWPFAALAVVIGLASGAYPAVHLASTRSNELFDNQKSSSGRRSWMRSSLVGIQFGVTVILIVTATVTFTQTTYLSNLDYGFRTHEVLVIENLPTREEAELREAYNRRLEQSSYIELVASSNEAPPASAMVLSLERAQSQPGEGLRMAMVEVDATFFELYEIMPIAGRTFSASMGDTMLSPSDDFSNLPDDWQYSGRLVHRGGKVIVSESAVAGLGFRSPEEALDQLLTDTRRTSAEGRLLTLDLSEPPGGLGTTSILEYEIVGVVPDVMLNVGQTPVEPRVYFFRSNVDRDSLSVTSVRAVPGGESQALAYAEQSWREMFPDRPFEYEFLENRIDAFTTDERKQSQIFISLTTLAILVTCLGLFGLVSFVATRRTREIAIRKVLGAKVGDVTRMLVWEFAKPILIASLIAWPVAWVLMRRWLDGFPYRIDLSPWFFIGATALALAVAFLTVIGRTWKAAQTHPAQALKYE